MLLLLLLTLVLLGQTESSGEILDVVDNVVSADGDDGGAILWFNGTLPTVVKDIVWYDCCNRSTSRMNIEY